MSETPWKTILTSIHLWAILVAHLGHSWGLSMLLTELPTYMKTVLHFDLKAVINILKTFHCKSVNLKCYY